MIPTDFRALVVLILAAACVNGSPLDNSGAADALAATLSVQADSLSLENVAVPSVTPFDHPQRTGDHNGTSHGRFGLLEIIKHWGKGSQASQVVSVGTAADKVTMTMFGKEIAMDATAASKVQEAMATWSTQGHEWHQHQPSGSFSRPSGLPTDAPQHASNHNQQWQSGDDQAHRRQGQARPSGVPSGGFSRRAVGQAPSGRPSGVPSGARPSGAPPSGAPPSGAPPRPSGARPSGARPSGRPPRPSGMPSGARASGRPGSRPPRPSGVHHGGPSGSYSLPPRPSGVPSGVPPVPPAAGVPSGAPSGVPSGAPPGGFEGNFESGATSGSQKIDQQNSQQSGQQRGHSGQQNNQDSGLQGLSTGNVAEDSGPAAASAVVGASQMTSVA